MLRSEAMDLLQPASSGIGTFFQRDYWAVIANCRVRPSDIAILVAARFPDFPPPEMVVFERRGDGDGCLELGEELDINIRMAGPARVRVVHKCPCSITLATLQGHPEAGRITFGAYRNDRGEVVFHIRSRARSSTLFNYVGFRSAGDPMQASTWTDFVNNVALTCGDGVLGVVHADTTPIRDDQVIEGDEAMDGPTFLAEAD
ncbi:MAG: DUF1990 family protein [Vicinamibacterales bacterium]